jgi:Tc5 transposase DNA-binding domain
MGKPQTRLNEKQKALVCEYRQKNPRINYEEIGKWAKKEFKLQFAPDPTTVGRILRNSTRYESIQPQNARLLKACVVKHPHLEQAMATWVLQMEHQKICLSNDLIQHKARTLATMMGIPAESFKASNGWLANFKTRNGLKQHRIHGQSGDAQMTGIEERMQILQTKISGYNYDDVYNMDETGLFYNFAPDKTIASRQIEGCFNLRHYSF